jgi:hypothetical protein
VQQKGTGWCSEKHQKVLRKAPNGCAREERMMSELRSQAAFAWRPQAHPKTGLRAQGGRWAQTVRRFERSEPPASAGATRRVGPWVRSNPCSTRRSGVHRHRRRAAPGAAGLRRGERDGSGSDMWGGDRAWLTPRPSQALPTSDKPVRNGLDACKAERIERATNGLGGHGAQDPQRVDRRPLTRGHPMM